MLSWQLFSTLDSGWSIYSSSLRLYTYLSAKIIIANLSIFNSVKMSEAARFWPAKICTNACWYCTQLCAEINGPLTNIDQTHLSRDPPQSGQMKQDSNWLEGTTLYSLDALRSGEDRLPKLLPYWKVEQNRSREVLNGQANPHRQRESWSCTNSVLQNTCQIAYPSLNWYASIAVKTSDAVMSLTALWKPLYSQTAEIVLRSYTEFKSHVLGSNLRQS